MSYDIPQPIPQGSDGAQNVGKGNMIGLLLWIFLIIQQKASLTTAIGKYQEFKLYPSC